MKNNLNIRAISGLLVLLSFSALTYAQESHLAERKWGQIVCKPVTKRRALQLARPNEFGITPPTPVGTFTCNLPL